MADRTCLICGEQVADTEALHICGMSDGKWAYYDPQVSVGLSNGVTSPIVDFQRAIEATIAMSRQDGKLYYLYRGSIGYQVSATYWADWLFLAYPGGRQVLSRDGKELLDNG